MEPDNNLLPVFVYGTLKQGHGNNGVMQRAKGVFVAEAKLSNMQLLHLGCFPGMVRTTNPEDVVYGEVWYVPPEGVPHLDALEGYDRDADRGMYLCRTCTPVSVEDPNVLFTASTYLWNREGRWPLIPSGKF